MDRLDGETSASALRLHDTLKKDESSVLTQMRTGCIEFAPFLHDMRVPNVESARRRSDTDAETVRHIVEECPLEDREGLGNAPNLCRLLNDKKGTRSIKNWFINIRRLDQFDLARELMYRAGEGVAGEEPVAHRRGDG